MNVNKLIIKITENWPAKVLSVALAIILFVFHRMNTLTTRPISVPLAIETGSTMTPASSYPQSVRVNLRGEDDDIKSIADSDIEAYVDFSRYESEGLYRAPVQIR
ncbi:MAG: CdaR family protein, partial [Treponema sp.]|nr:CdaR family protein [Treponema sp.]